MAFLTVPWKLDLALQGNEKIVVTGGAGFIGSHVAETIFTRFPSSKLLILDKMTYAADVANIEPLLKEPGVTLVEGDICDLDLCRRVTKDTDLVVHLAAESTVDNSFGNSLLFTRTNALGTHALMEACLGNRVGRTIHVSTESVYGQTLRGEASEDSVLSPTNPYSASKAGAEMIVRSFVRSYDLNVVTARAGNIYGTRQYPEKIIPKFILNALRGRSLPLHGEGRHVRRYLAVQDFAEAILTLVENGEPGSVYNVGSTDEFSNSQIARMICEETGADPERSIQFVEDRPFNDKRYAVSLDKIKKLGWSPRRHLADDLSDITSWYRKNGDRYPDQ